MHPDDPLSKLLKSWREQPPADPQFQAEVWDRIRAAKNRRDLSAILARLFGIPAEHFPRVAPLAASLVLGVAALIGFGAGRLQAEFASDARNARAYARTIDPLQMTELPDHR